MYLVQTNIVHVTITNHLIEQRSATICVRRDQYWPTQAPAWFPPCGSRHVPITGTFHSLLVVAVDTPRTRKCHARSLAGSIPLHRIAGQSACHPQLSNQHPFIFNPLAVGSNHAMPESIPTQQRKPHPQHRVACQHQRCGILSSLASVCFQRMDF